ncbi:MAG: type III PLP-dependent enzyme [Mycobacteriaceae bacterium]|nr:type III PLP-dependent enzyme [Mycobacteriaceae bacterium]
MEGSLVYSAAAEAEQASSGPPSAWGAVARARAFLDEQCPPSPCLVIDLATVRERYRALAEALPGAQLFYAVKANPAADVVRELVRAGASFDVASVPEIELCLAQGADPAQISYGNTIKKHADVAAAYTLGVRLFTTDSIPDVEAIAQYAPGASVFGRIMLVDTGSLTPFGRKFGCSPDMAVQVLSRAHELGLRPAGVSFHVGSQQLDPQAWDRGVREAAAVAAKLAAQDVTLPLINVGGGLPGSYTVSAPPLAEYAAAIEASVREHFGAAGLPLPSLVVEPGRFVVADAGLLRSEVVLVSRKSDDDEFRWVYLDVGRYNGMAECENEYITYLLSTPEREGEVGPVYLAGPTCDGDDVLYQRNIYRLPLALRAGDHVEFLSTGAYTASYSSIAFNGFSPLPTHCI